MFVVLIVRNSMCLKQFVVKAASKNCFTVLMKINYLNFNSKQLLNLKKRTWIMLGQKTT